MDHIPPFYSESALAAITKKLYGLEGDIKPLVSYEDQNARLTVGADQYVLKIANANMDTADLAFQNATLEHLEKVLPDAGLPRVIHNLKGDTIAMHEGHAVRLLTFVPGSVYAHAKRTLKLHASFGRYMATFNSAMQGFEHSGAVRPGFIWGLDNVMLSKPFVHHIVLEDNRARVERYFARYEAEVLPKLKSLRKAIIHQDANDHNVLVNEAGEVSGLIDFGDVMWGSLINELAIMLAYGMQNTDDILGAAEEIITGYNEVFPLEEDEIGIVLNLAAMRIVQSVTLSSRDSRDDPDNAYLVVSQTPGFALLEKLEAIGPGFLRSFAKQSVEKL